MADWFETRFRAPVDAGRLDPAFAARMRALVVEEWHSDAPPSSRHVVDIDALATGREGDVIMLEVKDPVTDDGSAPRRRRSFPWWLVAAAAVVAAVLVVGVLAGSAYDRDDVDTATSGQGTEPPPGPAARPVLDVGDFQPLEPGWYSIDPDGDDATQLRVVFEVAAEGWESWIGAVKFNEDGHVALSITTIDNVVHDACRDQRPLDPAIGPTVDDLVLALTQLPPFDVTSPPRDVAGLGYRGTHLELTVPEMPARGVGSDRYFTECTDRALHSWIAPNLGGTFYGYNGEAGRTEDFWILDVDGTRLVLVTTTSPESTPQDVAELRDIFESIRIEP